MRLLTLAPLALILGAAAPAAAEPLSLDSPKPKVHEPPVALALVVGAATAMIPFAIGGTMMTFGGDPTSQNAGAMIAEAGFTLAPFTTHAVLGEWGRGLAFAALPAAGTGAMTTLLAIRPDAVQGGALGTNYAFVVILLGTMMSSTIGVVDAVYAPERARARLRLTPIVGRGLLGFGVGGEL